MAEPAGAASAAEPAEGSSVAVPAGASSVAVPAGAANRSHDRAGRLVGIDGATQVELHPRDVVPAAALPLDASI